MADEITYSLTLSVENAEMKPGTYRITNLKVDQTTQGMASGVQAIGTSEEALAFPSGVTIASGGTLLLRNIDGTNFVQVGYATGVYVQRLTAQGIPLTSTMDGTPTIYLKADTAECNVYWEYYLP